MNEKHPAILRLAIFLASVIIVLLLIPHSDDRKYAFEENRPWGHSLLTAPFNIPVYLDSATYRMKRDSLERTFLPVFRRDESWPRQLQRQLLAVKGISPEERTRLRQAVERLYSDGIVSTEDYQSIRSRGLREVRFVGDNTVVRGAAGSLRSPRTAYSRLDSIFAHTPVRQAMTTIGLPSLLKPNVVLDTIVNEQLYTERMQQLNAATGMIQEGERIIDRGDRVTPELYTILTTYTEMLESRDFTDKRGGIYLFLGQVLYVILLFGSLFIYLHMFRPRIYYDIRKLSAIMLAVVGLYVIASIVSANIGSGIYLIPFAILPVMFVVFFDARTAQFGLLIEVLLCSVLVSSAVEFIFLEMLAGMASIFTLRELTKRSQLLRTALAVFLVYSVSYVAMELMHSGTLSRATGTLIGYFAINAVLISFAYVLIFVFEKLFGMTSMVTLVELSDINNHLLRELSEECPGTFQHSMSVSNLASDAARKIDANVLIVRAGALYHDIGKISNPAFFTENQHGVNPHNALDPIQSARIITGHITEGLKMAEKENLPQVLRDMILQHHGRGVAKFFYTTFCNAHPGETVDPAPFTYPGPNPQTREASLLMMADSVEAASRSLREYSTETITELVNRIIDGQIDAGLHNDSPISFRDIKTIKETFIQRLRTIYHVRISYPDEKK